MKNALISPMENPIYHISEWNKLTPIYSPYPNSCRVAEVTNISFEVGSPLFWVECNDDVVQDQFYFDTVNNEILPIVNAEPIINPADQPTTNLPTA